METLLTARQSTLRDIAGACTNSEEFRAKLNEATRRLLRRGDWPGTVVRIGVCVRNGCIVWPRYVGTIRKVNQCLRDVPVGNIFKDFILDDSWQCYCGREIGVNSWGRSPVFQDIQGDARTVRLYAPSYADIGKTVRIFGVDNGNQTLFTRNSDGTREDGVVLTVARPYAETTMYVRRIDRVIKEITEGPAQLFAYNTTDNVLEDVATYEPGETNPDYQRSQVILPNGWNAGSCGCLKFISALVKLQFVPVVVDTDLVLIDNLDALLDMMMSIDRRKAGNISDAAAYEASSINELNRELEDRSPADTIPINMGVLGGTSIGWQKVF